jgi:hypothetical protein
MNGASRDAVIVACALAALTLSPACAARAGARGEELCTREDAQTAGPGATDADGGPHPAAARQANAISAETVHVLPAVTVDSRSLAPSARRGFWPALFVDHLDLATRLRAIRRLKLVPVFDNARITVFIGVDRHGVAGLHFQQQDANDLPPLLARTAPLAEPPPLRAVPLRLP